MIEGFTFAAVSAGIKKAGSDKLDLALVVADRPAVAAGVTTTNLVCAAPVVITRKRLAGGLCRAILINSGNANAYTGRRGMEDAITLTRAVSEGLESEPELVIPMSTGVIGNPMPMERIGPRIPELPGRLDGNAHMDVARAMMTTDTKPKTVILDGTVSDGSFRMLGLAKGAGMMAPDMATMLAVILTDLRVEQSFLQESLQAAAAVSFNRITVDGDTSTNDTLVVLAGGSPHARDLGSSPEDRRAFADLLTEACIDLSRQIVFDGEGVTKVVHVQVCGAPDEAAALRVARTIAESPLVKTAFHGEDPNWGRIICAAGRAGVSFDPDHADLCIGDVPIVRNGTLVPDDWETSAHRVMQSPEFTVILDLKAGTGTAEMLTTDLSEEYVGINADYRS